MFSFCSDSRAEAGKLLTYTMQTPDAASMTIDAFLTSSALTGRLPLVLTPDMQRFIDSFHLWLQRETREPAAAPAKKPDAPKPADDKQAKEATAAKAGATSGGAGGGGLGLAAGSGIVPFLIVGPDGCGKTCLLEHCFAQLRSTNVATVHCSAQTSPAHILQKLKQVRVLYFCSGCLVCLLSIKSQKISHLCK